MTTKTDTAGEHRGYDDEGHKVVVGWVNADGTEYLIGVTHCCGASSKATEYGIVCRSCYGECSQSLGADAHVVRGPESGIVTVPKGGWGWKEIDGRWQSVAPTEYVVREGEEILFTGTHGECVEYATAWNEAHPLERSDAR